MPPSGPALSLNPERDRFHRHFALALFGLSCLLGVTTTMLQSALALGGGAAADAIRSALAASAVRALAPGAVGSALLVALVLWAQPLRPNAVQPELRGVLKRALLLLIPGYAAAIATVSAAAFAVAGLAFGVGWTELAAAAGSVTAQDLAAGAVATLLDAGLIALLARQFLARLKGSHASLPAQLVLSWTVSAMLRAMLAVMVGALLPG